MIQYTLLSFEDRWGADSAYELNQKAYFESRRTRRPLKYPRGEMWMSVKVDDTFLRDSKPGQVRLATPELVIK